MRPNPGQLQLLARHAQPAMSNKEALEALEAGERDRVVHSLMGIAVSIALRFAERYQQDAEDLLSEALEVLVRYGVDGFDPERGVPLRTWCGLTIRRRLARMVQAHRVYHTRMTEIGCTMKSRRMYESHGETAEANDLLAAGLASGAVTWQEAAALVLECRGCTNREVGIALGVPRKTAWRIIKRAKDALRAEAELC